jgi:uncharacterized membrane protein
MNGPKESVTLRAHGSSGLNWPQRIKRYGLTGLFVLVPAWGTFLILHTLFITLDSLIVDILGTAVESDVPGLGVLVLLVLILLTGVLATHFFGQRILRWTDESIQCIPLVRGIYQTLKGMTDLFNFQNRFGNSTVVVFPFPREGLWALGFVFGTAPVALQVTPGSLLAMVFVPTAIHPFTGYLAFVPESKLVPIKLSPEDAMKMEFSAGLYHPESGWLRRLSGPSPAGHAKS